MKTRVALGLLALLFGAGTASGDEAAMFKKYMLAQANDFKAAFNRKDAKGVERNLKRLMVSSFEQTLPGGEKRTRKQIIQGNIGQFGEVKTIVSQKTTYEKIAIRGGQCTTHESFEGEFVVKDDNEPGKWSKMRVESRSIGRYMKLRGIWKQVSSQSLSRKAYLDGKPIPIG